MNEREARDKREELLGALSDGRMDPPEAEAEAAELGLAPLTTPLDKARYDPMRAPRWTLAMALAWIVWRTSDAVRDLMPRWRHDLYGWYWRDHVVSDGANGTIVRGGWLWERVHKDEAPFLFLCLGEAFAASEGRPYDHSARMTLHDARHDLWEKLGAGAVQATTTAGADVIVIPAHEWPHLEHAEERNRDVLYLRGCNGGVNLFAGVKYENEILLPRDKVLELWPADGPTVAGERRAEAALREAANAAQRGAANWPKSEEWRTDAVSQHNVTKRGAVRVWSTVAKDFPKLASPKGKPKTRRAANPKPKRRTK
jgi:hypothetical protein